MRKIVVCVGVFMLVLPMLAFAGCKKREKKLTYRIRAEYFDEERRLKGEMQVSVPNRTENTLAELPFFLYANAFSEQSKKKPVSDLYASAVYYDGASYGGMEIHSVEGGGDWRIDGNGNLLVSLDKPLYPDESVTLRMQYEMTLPKANYRFGAGERCVNLSCFYPQLPAQTASGFVAFSAEAYGDPCSFDTADFEAELTATEGTGVACAGRTSAVTENGKTTYHAVAEDVRDMAFVLGDFQKLSAECGGILVDYYYFADEFPEKTLLAATDALRCYEKLFCDYPYARYAFAETSLAFGGMEYSGFAMISSALKGSERISAVAHETAHMWWRVLVGSDEYGCAWQDEGLAEYSTALFYENNPAYGREYGGEVAACLRAYRDYYSVKSQLSGSADTSMTRALSEFSSDYEYRILAYDKGVILFDRLRQAMGDKKFFSCLKKYAERYGGRMASEYDFIACFSDWEGLVLSFTEGRCVI